MPKLNIKLEGIDYILHRLSADYAIYAIPWKQALIKATKLLRDKAESRSPVKTGSLKASIRAKMDPHRVPRWGVVTAHAEGFNGWRYGFSLQAGKGKKYKSSGINSVTHYRGTSKKTKNWFEGTKRLSAIRNQMQTYLNDAAKEIEKRWQR